jgi:hypothetical protein
VNLVTFAGGPIELFIVALRGVVQMERRFDMNSHSFSESSRTKKKYARKLVNAALIMRALIHRSLNLGKRAVYSLEIFSA